MAGNHSISDTKRNGKTLQGQCLTAFQRKWLQKSLGDDLQKQYRLRIEIMLLADEGKTQAQICRTLGCSPGTARHWMAIARAGLAHNFDDFPVGRPKIVNDQYLKRLKELIEQNPKELGYPFRRWTGQWLSKHLAKEFGICVSDRSINRLLKEMGLSTREKPASSQKSANQTNTSTNLVIRDLSGDIAPESLGLWSFNSIS